jgi:hypothetical protein
LGFSLVKIEEEGRDKEKKEENLSLRPLPPFSWILGGKPTCCKFGYNYFDELMSNFVMEYYAMTKLNEFM